MEKNLRKIISLILVLAMSFAISVPAFAEQKTNVKDSNVSGSNISYISESDALLLAEQCIAQQIVADNHCLWNSSTKVNEIVKLYDFEDNVNSYLFRLMTNNKKQGYVFVNATCESPSVQAFGYDCNFMLDVINIKNIKRIVNKNDHIIYAGSLTFLQKVNNYQVRELSTNTIVVDDIENLNNSYKQSTLQIKDNEAKLNLIEIKDNIMQDTTATSKSKIYVKNQVIYDKADLANIWNNTSANIFVTNNFSQDNNCAPTSGTNFVYYWSHLSPNKIPNLWSSAKEVENRLYSFFATNNPIPGSMPWNLVPGLNDYAIECGYPIAGSDYVSDVVNHWSWYTANIKHNLPILFTVALDPKYGQHVMLIVGYQNTDTGRYFRVADGWSSTYSNFYKTGTGASDPDRVINACYVRW